MTIGQAIEMTDSLKQNKYKRADKVRWLSELDALIWQELIATHELPERRHCEGWIGAYTVEPVFLGYPEDVPDDTELLVKFPNDNLYILYLQSQIDYYNAEITKYNNSRQLFNNAYLTYTDWYNRTHMPKQGSGFVFTERRAGEKDALST